MLVDPITRSIRARVHGHYESGRSTRFCPREYFPLTLPHRDISVARLSAQLQSWNTRLARCAHSALSSTLLHIRSSRSCPILPRFLYRHPGAPFSFFFFFFFYYPATTIVICTTTTRYSLTPAHTRDDNLFVQPAHFRKWIRSCI